MDVGIFSPGGGGYGVVEFLTLLCDPLECDSSGRRGVIHRRSVPTPHTPPWFAVEGGIPVQQYFHVLYQRRHPPLPVFF